MFIDFIVLFLVRHFWLSLHIFPIQSLITISNCFQTEFGTNEILRKYMRYALNEKPFNPDLIADLIQLRKASGLDDSQVAEVLNEISRRIVQDKGNQFHTSFDVYGWTVTSVRRFPRIETLSSISADILFATAKQYADYLVLFFRSSCNGYVRLYWKGFQEKTSCSNTVWKGFLFVRGKYRNTHQMALNNCFCICVVMDILINISWIMRVFFSLYFVWNIKTSLFIW